MLNAEQFQTFHDNGYVIVDDVLSADEVRHMVGALESIERAGDHGDIGISWSDQTVTTIQTLPMLSGLLPRYLQFRPIVEMVEQLVGSKLRATGGLMLDKDPKANWDIGWHQDTGIYVKAIPQGEPDDVRAGLPVLSTKNMELGRNVTCRLALDDSSPQTGGLYVLPGSHKSNLQPKGDVKERFAEVKGVPTTQKAGSVLCYCPLLLHRSEKSVLETGRRRVLVAQYGPADLTLPDTECYPFPQPVPLTAVDSLVA